MLSMYLNLMFCLTFRFFIPRSRSSTFLVGLFACTSLLSSLVSAVLASLSLPFLLFGLQVIGRFRIEHSNRTGCLRFVSALVRIGCLQFVLDLGLLALVGFISPMLGWLRLLLSVVALTSTFELFRGSTFSLFSQSEIEFVIGFGVMVTSTSFLLLFVVLRDFSPPQVRHIEVLQLVETKELGENVGVLPICRNIRKFNVTVEDMLSDKVILYLNVLSPGVEDEVLH